LALTRAQLVAGDSFQGYVLPGQVQGVKQGTGVIILPDGTINFDPTTATGVMRLNNPGAYNNYFWPTLAGAPAAGTILQSDGLGNVNWTSNYVPITSPLGAAQLPVGALSNRPLPPAIGQFRFNDDTDLLEYYNGTDWMSLVSIAPPPTPNPFVGLGLVTDGTSIKVSIPVSFGPPANGPLPQQAVPGSLYWDDNLGLMFIYYDDGFTTQWVQIIP